MLLGAAYGNDIGNLHFYHLFSAISVLNFASWESIVYGVIGIIVLIACASILMALLEKHMRIGKRTFNGIFSKLNDNLIPTCGYALLLIVIYELWSVITAALLFFTSRATGITLAYVFTILVFLGMHVVLLWAVSIVYLWLPCMQITGFKALEALHYTNQLSAEVKWRISVGQLISLLVAETAICLCAWFAIDRFWFVLLTTALYSVLIMVFCVRMQIAYFDLDNIERADLRKYYRR